MYLVKVPPVELCNESRDGQCVWDFVGCFPDPDIEVECTPDADDPCEEGEICCCEFKSIKVTKVIKMLETSLYVFVYIYSFIIVIIHPNFS